MRFSYYRICNYHICNLSWTGLGELFGYMPEYGLPVLACCGGLRGILYLQ